MKREWLIGILAVLLLSVPAGCGNNEASQQTNTARPVSVQLIREESRPLTLHYSGTLEPENTRALSFKTPGKIEEIFVQEGQMVKKGDPLALLEQEDLGYSLAAAKAQMEGARARYEQGIKGARHEEIVLAELDLQKARANYDFLKDHYEKVKTLNEAGVVSQQDLNEASLRMEQAGDSMKQAAKLLELLQKGAKDEEVKALFSQYEMALAEYEAREKLLEDSLITADGAAYVLKVVSQKSEVVAAGYPVVILGSAALKGRIGLTWDDLPKVKTGDAVDVLINDEVMQGTIALIHKIPDEQSRTYMTEIRLSNGDNLYSGAIINVTIPVGEQQGAWIPLSCILHDGAAYVFVVEGDRAARRSVALKSIREGEACVAGLKEGDLLITQGFKSIKDGYAVAAQINNY